MSEADTGLLPYATLGMQHAGWCRYKQELHYEQRSHEAAIRTYPSLHRSSHGLDACIQQHHAFLVLQQGLLLLLRRLGPL